MMTIYRAHVNGYFGEFRSLSELRTWATARRDRDCAGKLMTILQGTRHGDCDVYPGNCPRKEIVL
jgi:hypothetical protein